MSTKRNAVNLDELEDMEVEAAGNDAFDAPVDFGAIKGFEVVEPGEYRLRNEKVTLQLSKTSSQPKFTLRITVLSGPQEGATIFQDLSWAPKAQGRSKNLMVGMGLPANLSAPTLRALAEELQELEYFGIIDVEQSDGINERTQRPYDPRNRLLSTSQAPQTSGFSE